MSKIGTRDGSEYPGMLGMRVPAAVGYSGRLCIYLRAFWLLAVEGDQKIKKGRDIHMFSCNDSFAFVPNSSKVIFAGFFR